MSKSRLLRVMAVVAAGGMLLQSGGCITSIAPLALSVAESFLLTALVGQTPPFR